LAFLLGVSDSEDKGIAASSLFNMLLKEGLLIMGRGWSYTLMTSMTVGYLILIAKWDE
jgi:hypothetical protein